jgi:3-oxoadipate enol-lactonase
MRVTADDGVELEVSVDGADNAAALVFLHSLGCDRTMWDKQADRLKHHFRVIRPDIRGHGLSDAPRGDYTLARLGQDVRVVLDSLGISCAHVCGISLGGAVAQWLAIQAPSQVGRLTLANTASRIGAAASWQARIDTVLSQHMQAIADTVLGRFFCDPFRGARPDIVAQFRAVLLATAPHGYAGCCAALRDGDLTPELGRIGAPTLVIAGSRDVSTPPGQLETLARGIAGSVLVTLDTAHLSNIEQPAPFTEALRRHLEA